MWDDKCKEFYNRHVHKLATLYNTENGEKSSIVERWNRTMKEKMFKYFTANSTRKYVDILDKLVDRYNNTIHSSIGMTPKEASERKNEVKVWRNLYGNYTPQKRMTPKHMGIYLLGIYLLMPLRQLFVQQ